MKKTAIVGLVVLLTALSSAYGAPRRQQRQQVQQQRQQQEQKLQPGARPNAVRPAVRRSLLQDSLFGFYTKQFQRDSELSEVLPKLLPFIDEFLQERLDISERRARSLRQLRQAINRNGSEDDLKRLARELDMADADFQANHQRFLSNVDPFLNPRQQAKVRILQNMTDARLRQILDELQNPAGQRQNAAPAQQPN